MAVEIAKMPEVQFAAITTGPYEIVIQVVTESNRRLFDFLMRIGNLDGVTHTQTFLMLNIYKDIWNPGKIKLKGRGVKKDEKKYDRRHQ